MNTAPVPTRTQPLVAQGSPTNLRVGFLPAVDSLNPFIGHNEPSRELYGLLYDFLFSLDQDGNLVPNIAVNATTDATGANWTYQIRSGVVWSDGTALTADDVAFTFNYNIQNFFQLFAYELYVNRIVHCRSGQTTGCGAVVTSPGNVTIYFDRPFAAGKSLWVPIIQKAQWSGISPTAAQITYTNPNPIGTGPFIADPNISNEWVNNQPLHLTNNANYHTVGNHVGPAHVDGVYLEQFSSDSSLTTALQAGQVDLAELPAVAIPVLVGQPNIATNVGLQVNELFNEIGISQLDSLAANGRLNPARWDVNVRRAIAIATNKDFIVHGIYNDTGVRGSSLMSPVTPQWWYDPTADPGANLTYNLGASNALLNATGYDAHWTDAAGNMYRMASRDLTLSIQTNACGCANPTNVTKTVPTGTHLEFLMAVRSVSSQEVLTAQFLQSEYAKIGIKLDLKFESESALANDVYGGNVELYIWNWFADPDPNYLLSIETGYTLDGWNDNYWDNTTFNRLYGQQLAASDVPSRQQAVRAAEKLHYESAVYVIYAYPFGGWAWRTSNLTGWGDWSAHPYRQPDGYWGANPMFLDVSSGAASLTVTLSNAIGRPGHFVNITGTILAPSPGVWVLGLGDGTILSGNYTAGITSVIVAHVYSTAGNYTDGLTATNGTDSATARAIVVVDGTPPTIHTPSAIQAEATSAAGAVVFYSVNASDNVAVASGPTCSPASGSTFPLGLTTVACTATDTAGNVGRATFNVTVSDTTAPATRISSAVDGNGFAQSYGAQTPSTGITFAFNATDAVGVVGFVCSLDGAPFGSCSSPKTYAGLATGFHAFFVAGVDAAGNRQPVRFNWTVLSPTATVQDLIGKVGALQGAGKLSAKQAGTLLAPLNKAFNDLSAGKIGSAINDLQRFEALVAQDIKKGVLSSADGQPLVDEASDLIRVLGGTG